jgi:hypothetical protein
MCIQGLVYFSPLPPPPPLPPTPLPPAPPLSYEILRKRELECLFLKLKEFLWAGDVISVTQWSASNTESLVRLYSLALQGGSSPEERFFFIVPRSPQDLSHPGAMRSLFLTRLLPSGALDSVGSRCSDTAILPSSCYPGTGACFVFAILGIEL